jgi:hypothetical protein
MAPDRRNGPVAQAATAMSPSPKDSTLARVTRTRPHMRDHSSQETAR